MIFFFKIKSVNQSYVQSQQSKKRMFWSIKFESKIRYEKKNEMQKIVLESFSCKKVANQFKILISVSF